MPCWREFEEEEDWKGGSSDWNDDDADEEDDDEDPTVPCPHCRREIHDESERCPYCEKYVSREDAPPARKPWWFIVGFVACCYAIFRWIF